MSDLPVLAVPSMSAEVTVVVRIRARPGAIPALCEALVGLLAPTRREPGCLDYRLPEAEDEPGRFMFHERWTDRQALAAHWPAPHLCAYRQAVAKPGNHAAAGAARARLGLSTSSLSG